MNSVATVDKQSHSFLSGYIRQLICESFEKLEGAGINAMKTSDWGFTAGGYLQWEKIGTVLGQGIEKTVFDWKYTYILLFTHFS